MDVENLSWMKPIIGVQLYFSKIMKENIQEPPSPQKNMEPAIPSPPKKVLPKARQKATGASKNRAHYLDVPLEVRIKGDRISGL